MKCLEKEPDKLRAGITDTASFIAIQKGNCFREINLIVSFSNVCKKMVDITSTLCRLNRTVNSLV